MLPGEVASLRYLLPANTNPYSPVHFNMDHSNVNTFHFGSFFAPCVTAPAAMQQIHSIMMQAPNCASNNSTSDEADEHQQVLQVDERKRRRMISNRESARRSRMRKQKHMDELMSHASHLRAVNRRLVDELHRVIGDRDQMLQENSRLRDKASDLRQTLNNLETDEAGADPQDMDRSPSSTELARAESSN